MKIMSAGGKWIKLFLSSKEVASADSMLLLVQERLSSLQSSVEQNTSQEFELFTSESGRCSDSVSVVFVQARKSLSPDLKVSFVTGL